MNYLFIGGSADGKWIAVPEPVSIFRVPHHCGYDSYYATQLAGSDGERFTIYAEKNLSGSDVMRHLITNYRPVEQKAKSA